jgi:hypothetical protein
MNQFIAFDKNACRRLRDEMQAVLNKYAAETGIEITVGGMKFTSENVTIKVEAKKPGAKSQRDQRLDSALALNAHMDKLSLDEIRGKRLVGYNSRAYKMPYIYLEVATGKRYKCSLATARVYFSTPKSLAA